MANPIYNIFDRSYIILYKNSHKHNKNSPHYTSWHSVVRKRETYTLYCHANKITPFSWFDNIVISQEDYDNCKEIILHEEGHIIGKHSWDILFTSLLTPLQWFNPLTYMLINDLKDIHEYEADRYVLQKNNNAQAYQLLILKKAIGDEHYSLVNKFGCKSVRKRVEMMIRNRSAKVKLLKGLYLVPASVITVIFFAKPIYIYSDENKQITVTTTVIKPEEKNDTIKIEKPLQPTTDDIKVKKKENIIKREIDGKIAVTKQNIERLESPTPVEPDTTKISNAAQEKKVIYKNYPKNIIIDNVVNETNCNNYRCAVIMQFNIDAEGTVSNYLTKGCNVSIEGYRGNNKIGTISQLREYAIATAKKFIDDNNKLFISKEDEDILTRYTANLVLSSKKEESSSVRDVLWIGTTPLK